jgi:hypothetical protein
VPFEIAGNDHCDAAPSWRNWTAAEPSGCSPPQPPPSTPPLGGSYPEMRTQSTCFWGSDEPRPGIVQSDQGCRRVTAATATSSTMLSSDTTQANAGCPRRALRSGDLHASVNRKACHLSTPTKAVVPCQDQAACRPSDVQSRQDTTQDTTRTNQQVTASSSPDYRRPAFQVTKSRASRRLRSFQKQRNQFASHRPDEHHHSQQQPASFTSLLRGLRLLARHHPPYNRRRVSGRRWISWFTARGTGAAQTVWSEAASPSMTDQDPPVMLGKRTTQALVAQGIEHRFPKPCVAGSNPAGGTTSKQHK